MEHLEQRSTENLVFFYQDELRRIDRGGEKASAILSFRVRWKFIRLGIVRLGVGSPRSFVLTKKGREILAAVTRDRRPGGPGGHSRANPGASERQAERR